MLRLPKEGKRYELVNGDRVQMAPPGDEHGEIAATRARILGTFVVEHDLEVAGAAPHQGGALGVSAVALRV